MSINFSDINIIKLKSTASTNAYLWEHIKKGAQLPLVVITDEQTQGKGQQGNTWLSEKGKNITMSLALNPYKYNIDNPFLLNKVVCLAVRDCVAFYLRDKKICIKWPNDTYVDNKKISGILIENVLKSNIYEVAVIGIGLNINQELFDNSLANPTSLCLEKHNNFKIIDCLKTLLACIDKWFSLLIQNNIEFINETYLNNLYFFKQKTNFKYKGQILSATIVDVDAYGRLVISTDLGKQIHCDIKEISLLT